MTLDLSTIIPLDQVVVMTLDLSTIIPFIQHTVIMHDFDSPLLNSRPVSLRILD
jgi:hypothetical protein